MWQDDGTLCIDKNGYFSTATLATDDWSNQKVEELRKAWNNAYGWCPVKMDYKCRDKMYLRLRLIKLRWKTFRYNSQLYCRVNAVQNYNF